MQKFWYNVTKAGDVKYGPNGNGAMVQIRRHRNGEHWLKERIGMDPGNLAARASA